MTEQTKAQSILPMETKLTHHVNSDDLDEAINQHFGTTNFEFVPSELSNSGASHTYEIEERDEVDVWGIKVIENFKSGQFIYYSTQILLTQMAIDGVIPYGDYVIEVP